MGQECPDPLGQRVGGLGEAAFLGETGSPVMQPSDPGVSGQFGLRTADGEHLGAHGETFGASALGVQLSLTVVERLVQNVRAGRFGRIDGTRRGHRLLAQRETRYVPSAGAGVVAEALQGLGQPGQVGGGADVGEYSVGVDFLARSGASGCEQHISCLCDVVLIDVPRVRHGGDSACTGEGRTSLVSCALRPTKMPSDLS